jgi:hypothetical protein
VTTEFQTGLATASALATVDSVVDAILEDTGTTGVVIGNFANNSITSDVLAASAITEIQTGISLSVTAIAADDVDDSRTWTFQRPSDAVLAKNVVVVHPDFDGDLAFDFSKVLNQGSAINTVVSVSDQNGNMSVVFGNLRKTENGMKALFDVDGLTDNTDYIVKVTITTTDSQTEVRTGKLQARSE